MFLASVAGFIISSIFSDNYGVRKTLVYSCGIATLGSILMVTGFNLIFITIGVVLSGTGINLASSLAYGYISEVVEDHKRQKYSILITVSYTLGSMLLTVFYYWLENWRIITIFIQVIPLTITFLLIALYT